MSENSSNDRPGPVLLYDGECGLCNRTVRMMLRLDRRGVLRFAALQSEPAQEFLRSHGLPKEDFSTLVLVPDWAKRSEPRFAVRTDGVAGALWMCGGGSRVFAALLYSIPRFVREPVYKFVSRTRYRFFGPWRECPLPRPEWKKRFIE
ncbi:MAG TPA: DCC1-like thiol-disulfide oxidoreductase family protein [Opitutaceae bacterium]|jgi:predicted DCC family thiol-disulfide oxidoreductase YuxK|nr:DCC1-like thiol-disulfide oxidoreductase family protein [Opitutaceae bacterium]